MATLRRMLDVPYAIPKIVIEIELVDFDISQAFEERTHVLPEFRELVPTLDELEVVIHALPEVPNVPEVNVVRTKANRKRAKKVFNFEQGQRANLHDLRVYFTRRDTQLRNSMRCPKMMQAYGCTLTRCKFNHPAAWTEDIRKESRRRQKASMVPPDQRTFVGDITPLPLPYWE